MHETGPDDIGPPQETCQIAGVSGPTSSFRLYSVGRLTSTMLRNIITALQAQADILEECEREEMMNRKP
jgi:hypothetical protein